jgi:hypothetical protein
MPVIEYLIMVTIVMMSLKREMWRRMVKVRAVTREIPTGGVTQAHSCTYQRHWQSTLLKFTPHLPSKLGQYWTR